MFENNIIEKRILKRKMLMDELEKAKTEGIDWKIRQLEEKLYKFNSKHYPKVLWEYGKGTYVKDKEQEGDK